MLNSYGFDMWAKDYDKAVDVADENNAYPFAGYRKLMNVIYGTVLDRKPARVLDIGIGTGFLASKLYEQGNYITGIDFSDEMLNESKLKMPNAKFIRHDFRNGLPNELRDTKFDFIISTYAFHHLADSEKVGFLVSLLNNLNDDGRIIVGDVSFNTREESEECRKLSGDAWDKDEYYFVFDELEDSLKEKCEVKYHQFSHCSGILEISLLNKFNK